MIHAVFAQDQPSSLKFSGKGLVIGNIDFKDTIVWTMMHGSKGAIIIQSPQGRGIAHLALSPSNTCQSSTSICELGTVSDTKQIPIFQVGDSARFAINLDSKKETISILSGVIAGFNVTFSLSKMWSNSSTAANSTQIANPASVYCIKNNGTLQIQTINGGQTGICLFPNGSQCEEWQYFRGECHAAQQYNSTNSTSK